MKGRLTVLMRSSLTPRWLFAFAFALMCLCARPAFGATLSEAQQKMLAGEYADAIRLTREILIDNDRSEEARLLLAEAYLLTGQYDEAQAAITAGLKRSSSSIQLRLLGYDAFRQGGDTERADELLSEINELGGSRRWLYRDPENLVALGRAALLLGAEPKLVLENFFDIAKKENPKLKSAYLASGDLALQKGDDALASRSFNEGLKQFENDPDLLAGLAQSFAEGDRQKMIASLEAALDKNPRHQRALLLLIDHMIDAEQYEEAERLISDTLEVNPHRPEAWAYRAVIAHLKNKPEEEKEARERALRRWATNPQVDHLIGKQLSQKYRFAEGSAYQQQALKFEPKFTSAKVQLAQDLLRLGRDEEGWRLAHEAHEEDAYDTIAYNLVTLQDSISKFVILTNQHFRVRMSQREADVYGKRVLDLLGRARQTMISKYGATIADPTVVEIFPEQKDFAVRTFSMPGGVGYLGVCFGTVITANSPAAHKGAEINWESMLWHEFCHVITLQMTRNKMPRWLSEGISVYEEHQAHPSWGEQLTPEYRDMILGGEMKKIADLSSAFMSPKSPTHLQFGYYQSYMVVDFIVSRFGIQAIRNILNDLGKGSEINEAIAAHTEPMDKLEKSFAEFAEAHAKGLAPELDFSKPKRGVDWSSMVGTNNFYRLTRNAADLFEQGKRDEAIPILQRLIDHYPRQTGAQSAHAMLAEIYRTQGKTNEEKRVLTKWAEVDAEALDAYARLLEIGAQEKDWTAVIKHADRYLAVNPLHLKPYVTLASAHEALNKPDQALAALETALALDPPDPVTIHYKSASLLRASAPEKARHHLLQALEEAPRFREAHKLLRELTPVAQSTAQAAAESKTPPTE
ncbi:MAG TPA: tetratricopeptide repeat protein [Methylomirabilota bacterium]|nr:tetratricopeptide repeat protein [Methylomirabilota bacterium]